MITDLDVGRLVEPVHLVEELEEDPLDLPVGAGLGVESLGGDRVDLIDEDDGGGVLLGQAEDIPHHAGPLAEVLLDKLATHHPESQKVQTFPVPSFT